MRKVLLILILVYFTGTSARANHIYGVDFFYQHISGYTYRINLVIYGDCASGNYGLLDGSIPKVQILNGSSLVTTVPLTQTSGGVDVTPVCVEKKDSTQCVNPTYAIPGVGKFVYTGIYTFSGPSANWHFYFNGDLSYPASSGHRAGRANNISNISSGSVIAMDAALNNSLGPNSSPTFTTIPTPFYCMNVAQHYNPGAVDINGDSLSYSLIPGLNSPLGMGGGSTVNYTGGATATAPLTTATGSFSFSATTGQLSFNPSAVQRSLVVQQVTEYRNGVIVGTAAREMTFIVLSACNSTPSSNIIDTNKTNMRAAVRVNANSVNICYGADSTRFRITTINPGGDTINASISGLPIGAIATITQNNTPNPVILVDWNLPSLFPGNYNFFVTYKDNGCPLSSQQTQAYTVSVIRPNEINTTILAPTQCAHKAYVGYSLSYGLVPRTVVLEQNGVTVLQYKDTTGSFADSLDVGNYQVTVFSPNLSCSTSHFIRVVDSGIYPNKPLVAPVFYCLNDPSTELVATPDSGATLIWYAIEGNRLAGPPTPRTDTAGIFYWLVAQRMKVCNSLTDTAWAYVTKRPTAEFELPTSICANDTATIMFSGTIGVGPILEYFWDWGDAQIKSGQDGGPWRIYWHTPGTKKISLVVAENKCRSLETEHTLDVRPVPFAGFEIGPEVCEYDTIRVRYNSIPHDGQKYQWSFQDADTLIADGPGPYLLRWHGSGIKVVSLTVDLDGCRDTRTAEVTIHPAPDARILNPAGPVCIGDKIYLKASGGVSFVWAPADSLLYTADGELYAQILKPTTYRLQVRSEFGCVDSAAIRYDVVEPCCQFSYPNAFTPNGDGRNDRFRIVTYGNHLRYELSIYNNWGQRVYYGLDAEEGWDGNFRGKHCEPGTYFYYLNATCFTGRQETHKGDLMLIR